MKVQNISTFNQNKKNEKPKFNPAFKQILPEHLYINSIGFGQDSRWANQVIKIIEETKNEVLKKLNFKNVIDSVSKKYSSYYQQIGETDGLGPLIHCNAFDFGEIREGSNDIWSTSITEYGKFGKYREPLIDLVFEKGAPREGSLININEYLTTYKTRKNEDVPLAKIVCSLPSADLDYSLLLQSPPVESTPKIFEEIDYIYKKIINNKKALTAKNISTISKDVAKTYWLLSQLRPYKRGSAGIAEMIAKSLFEVKGIQVSPYKQDINPNLEAFVMPLDHFMDSYEGFFTERLAPISNKNIR